MKLTRPTERIAMVVTMLCVAVLVVNLTPQQVEQVAWCVLCDAMVQPLAQPVEVQEPQLRSLMAEELIDINTAVAEDLERLPNIGATRAAAIVAYRTEHGRFETTGELISVSGIGEVTLAEILPYITVS